MAYQFTLPDIEECFLPPDNWSSDSFSNPETDHNIHYNFCLVQNAKGTVVALPGLSEYGEKYIETARFFNEQGYDFYVIDWAYQGRSTRFEENHHKRHSDGFDTDVSDLHFMIENIVKVDKPLFMLAHSMGGLIGLNYIQKHSDIFNAASLTAPLFGIWDLRHAADLVCKILSTFESLKDRYIPRGRDWSANKRIGFKQDIFSNDKTRDKVHNAWCVANPELQVGNATMKWLCESLQTIKLIRDEDVLQNIKTPLLVAYATDEKIVDNDAIIEVTQQLPNVTVLKLENSKHEILMEKDDVRNKFLTQTLALFKQ